MIFVRYLTITKMLVNICEVLFPRLVNGLSLSSRYRWMKLLNMETRLCLPEKIGIRI